MARTIRTKVFKFNELSAEAKKVAIESLWDISVDYEWWESVYEDANNIGLTINGFDIDRGSFCEGEFDVNGEDAALKILKEHGETCETYKTAQAFLDEIRNIKATTPVLFEEGTEDEYEDYTDREQLIEDAEKEFLDSLCSDYLTMLRNEYEYLTSEENIIEMIEANDYEFHQSGKKY